MANKVFIGDKNENGRFYDDQYWSPSGAPQSGDTAVINRGTVSVINHRIDGVAITLNQAATTGSSEIVLGPFIDAPDISVLGVGTTLNVTNSRSGASVLDPAPVVDFESAYNQGVINIQAVRTILTTGVLYNSGTINVIASTAQFNGAPGNLFQNDGTLAVVQSRGSAPFSTVEVPITGQGSVQLGAYGTIRLSAGIADTQLILFNGGADQYEQLDLVNPKDAKATIAGFSNTDIIRLLKTSFTSVSYTNTGTASGTLNLFNGTETVATLAFAGRYTLDSFTIASGSQSSGPDVVISTTANEAQFGKLPAGYGYATRPIYRFFDTTDGTQFVTSSTNERDAIQATRPDLVQESGSFLAVAFGEAGAAPVYRFFDTRFGTHFLTASITERDSIIAHRTDLIYEPSSTFFEHSTQQANDVAVHRFYETGTGTHFYTGNQAEYQAIITPGSASYRSDFVSEGVTFFAPKASVG
ncbi:MAG: hypothetical protein EOO77_03570 [Oxalobacteraceae bacterium]|nr:MAG: hypothetical protein EOO77_03570 [Oxalobacteraceae bacterium]